MRATILARALGPALAGLLVCTATQAQNPVHSHVGHATDAFDGTPGGQGLLPTALVEARVAAQHAALAAADPANLDGMRRHAGHVLHALDPTIVAGGPGLGYGVRAAASAAAQHLELALSSEGVTENVELHAGHALASLANARRWTDQAVALAQRIQTAGRASDAASLVTQLDALCQSILYGRDTNRDGRVGWEEGEGGLAQASYHMKSLQRGEGLR